jgi:hypothetical protein
MIYPENMLNNKVQGILNPIAKPTSTLSKEAESSRVFEEHADF